MLEYASRRTTCRCCSATRLPIDIVRMDRTPNTGVQYCASGWKATNMIWSRPANPAAFDATDRNAATGTGDPSYVSGARKWNGTEDTLNANPATTNRMPAMAIPGEASPRSEERRVGKECRHQGTT